jgi:hypothetical protein
MKTKTFLVLAATLLSTSFAHAGSDSNICGDAVEAVCDSKSTGAQKAILAQQVMNNAAKQAQAFMREQPLPAKEFLVSIPQFIANAGTSQEMSYAMTRGLAYLACLDFLARGYFSSSGDYGYLGLKCFPNGPTNSVADTRNAFDRLGDVNQHAKALGTFKRIKELTLKVVQESNYSASLKPALVASVQRTDFFSMKDFVVQAVEDFGKAVQKKPEVAAATPDAMLQILSACDPKAIAENAFNFATVIDSPIAPSITQHHMVICPSTWLYGTRFTYRRIGDDHVYNPNEMARDALYVKPPVISVPEMSGNPDNLVSIVAHELGHSVDISIQQAVLSIKPNTTLTGEQSSSKSTMQAFTSCIARRHVDSGKLTASFMATPLDRQDVAFLFFNEYHADSVAANVLSLYLKKYPDAKTRQGVMKEGLKLLCGSEKHEPFTNPAHPVLHPAGNFRIRTTYLGNNNLRKTLGCTQLPKVFSCSFR